MIDITLLPYHLRPIKRTPLPYILSFLAAVLVFAGLAAVFVGNQADIFRERRTLKANQAALEKLGGIVDEWNDLAKEKQHLATKIATIDEIVRDRVIWSRQLWNIARLAPDNLWFSGISVTTKKVKQRETYFDEKAEKEKIRTITVERPILELSGYVTVGPDGTNDVTPLLWATQDDEEFASLFQLENVTFDFKDFEGFPVRGFSLEYLITREGAQL